MAKTLIQGGADLHAPLEVYLPSITHFFLIDSKTTGRINTPPHSSNTLRADKYRAHWIVFKFWSRHQYFEQGPLLPFSVPPFSLFLETDQWNNRKVKLRFMLRQKMGVFLWRSNCSRKGLEQISKMFVFSFDQIESFWNTHLNTIQEVRFLVFFGDYSFSSQKQMGEVPEETARANGHFGTAVLMEVAFPFVWRKIQVSNQFSDTQKMTQRFHKREKAK